MEFEGVFFNTSDYQLRHEKLGKGSFGTVYIAENEKDKQQYAAKIINVDQNFDGYDQMLLLRESLILHKLDHPSIVKFKGLNFQSFKDSLKFRPTIITEYLKNGSIKDNLIKEKQGLADNMWTPTKKYITLIGIADAMRYLHSLGIIHRDLKPENILSDDDFYPRVCDFGLSRCFSKTFTKSVKLTMTGEIGTPLYMSPELLRGEEHYGPSVDVYAFSILAYEIVSGKEPYFELGEIISPFALANRIMGGYRPKRADGITDKMWDLLCKCWSENSEERPTFEFIFTELSNDRDYFFEELDEEELTKYFDRLLEKMNKDGPKVDEKKNFDSKLRKLKRKIHKFKEKNEALSLSNDDFCSGLASILGPKKLRNHKRAILELSISSSKGNRYASFILGLLHESGEKVDKDIVKSLSYYEKSYNQGNPSGFQRIGRCYELGNGVMQDYSKAIEYYEKAAEHGCLIALTNLGVLYSNGKGVQKDYSKAKELYQKAAEFNNPSALTALGTVYTNGFEVEKDYSKAIEYYEKAAELGDPNAFTSLGVIYYNGQGVQQDYVKANEYYQKAAEL